MQVQNTSPIVIYHGKDNHPEIRVRFDGETVWLNRMKLAELFNCDVKTIGKHIKNALSQELSDFPVVAKFATTAADDKTYQVEHYNLDMILSVGYRVNSAEGVRFHMWGNGVLKDYLLCGYALNRRRFELLNTHFRPRSFPQTGALLA